MGIPIPDAYLSLQRGVVDGTTVPAEAIIGFRLYEVAPYLTYVATTAMPFVTTMNKVVWNELPKDIQDALMSVSGETLAVKYGRDAFDATRKEMLDVIKAAGYKAYEYTPPAEEVAKWADVAGKPVWDGWVKKMEGKGYKTASKILEDMFALVKQYSK